MQQKSILLTLVGCFMLVSHAAIALDSKPDGEWRGLGSLSYTNTSGNNRTSALNLTFDAARQTAQDKITFYAQALQSSSTTDDANGQSVTTKTSDLWRVGSRYDYNISTSIFAFGGLDLERDPIKSLDQRTAVNAGLGYHWIKSDATTLDVFGGFNQRHDKYKAPGVEIENMLRESYTSTEVLLGEEFSQKINDSVSLKQRYVAYPNLKTSGKFRSVLDIGLSVAINKAMSLTVGFQHRYDSLAAEPLKKGDTLFMTGISVSLGGN